MLYLQGNQNVNFLQTSWQPYENFKVTINSELISLLIIIKLYNDYNKVYSYYKLFHMIHFPTYNFQVKNCHIYHPVENLF